MRKLPFLAASLALAAAAHGLDFTATFDPSTTPAEKAAMQTAMSEWASKLTNVAHVNVAFVPDPSYGNTYNAGFGYNVDPISYSTYKAALAAHASSALDAAAVGYLQATTTGSFGFLINDTNQAGGAKHLATSDEILATPALEKALGGIGGGAPVGEPDFTIGYNPDASRFDFDRSDGIDAGKVDFQGVMLTQLGQGLGFTNRLDDLDYYVSVFGGPIPFDDADANGLHAPEDLFRYESLGGLPIRSWTAGADPKYFSVDGGVTSLGGLHTGVYEGDGYTTGSLIEPDGVFLRPTPVGREFDISTLDLKAMDAIGWNVRPVPEPGSLVPLALGTLALLRRRRRA